MVQVVPYDVLLAPGKKQTYKVRVFNARGQLLPDALAKDAKFARGWSRYPQRRRERIKRRQKTNTNVRS